MVWFLKFDILVSRKGGPFESLAKISFLVDSFDFQDCSNDYLDYQELRLINK